MLGMIASECQAQKKLTDYYLYESVSIQDLSTDRVQIAIGTIELFFDEQAREIHVYMDGELTLDLSEVYFRKEKGIVYFVGVDNIGVTNSGWFEKYKCIWIQGVKYKITFIR